MSTDLYTDDDDEISIDPELLAELQKDAAVAVRRIRESFAARTHGSPDEYLTKQLKWLAHALDRPRELDDRTWSALMREGLPDVYIDAVLGDSFFEEEPALVIAVIAGLTNMAKGTSSHEMEDEKTALYLIKRCPEIFKALWEHRDCLKDLDASTPATLYTIVTESTFAWFLFHFADMYQVYHGYSAGVDTYIPHVSLYCWVHIYQPGDVDFALSGLRFLTDRNRPCASQTQKAFIEDVVIDTIGGENVLKSFERDLKDAFLDDAGDGGNALEAIAVIPQLVKHPKMQVLVQERETFRRIVEYLDRRIRSVNDSDVEGLKSGWTEWELALLYFETVYQSLSDSFAHKDMSHISVRGEDVVIFLARGTEWMSRGVSRDASSDIAGILRAFGRWAKMREWREVAQTFLDGLIRGTRSEWIPTLNAIDAGAYRRAISGRVHNDLSDAWKDFGMRMGLNENKERKRVQIERQKFCSYTLCQFNRNEPQTALLSCKGCGEARYCGKECQLGDWKVHKKTCGRRLK